MDIKQHPIDSLKPAVPVTYPINTAKLALKTVDFPKTSELFANIELFANTWHAVLHRTVPLPDWGLRRVFANYAIPYDWSAVAPNAAVAPNTGVTNRLTTDASNTVGQPGSNKPLVSVKNIAHQSVTNQSYVYAPSVTLVYRNLGWFKHTKFKNAFKKQALKNHRPENYGPGSSRLTKATRSDNSSSLLRLENLQNNVELPLFSRPLLSWPLFSRYDLSVVNSRSAANELQKNRIQGKPQRPALASAKSKLLGLSLSGLSLVSIASIGRDVSGTQKPRSSTNKLHPVNKRNHLLSLPPVADSSLDSGASDSGATIVHKTHTVKPLSSQAPSFASLILKSEQFALPWRIPKALKTLNVSNVSKFLNAPKRLASKVLWFSGPRPPSQIHYGDLRPENTPSTVQNTDKSYSVGEANALLAMLPGFDPQSKAPGSKVHDMKASLRQAPVQHLIRSLAQKNDTQQRNQQQTLTLIQQQLLEAGQANSRELKQLQQGLRELKSLINKPKSLPISRIKPPSFFGPL